MQQFYFLRNLINNNLKKIILLYCFAMTAVFAMAQKQANTWFFGKRVGLDFNQSPPLALFTGALNSEEGCSVISDHNGKLLFYTNGLVALNRKNGLMKNGSGLMGDLSSTDNALVVPSPGNDSIYYLFTVGAAYSVGKGFRYNVINMNGDGGFGEITDKNVSVEPASYEKLAAIRHCNNKDVWVVIHKWNTDEYHAYLVTSAGVSATPVISHTGLMINNIEDNTIGTLKFSTNGRQLAAVHSYENNVVELMDFDNTTGLLSNALVFRPSPPGTPQTYTGAYGAEFSPNGKILYVTDNSTSDDPSTLYQFDISVRNAPAIIASRQVIYHPTPWFAGGLQTGPDHKIYMSMLSDSALSVIENPDVYGPGCNFSYNKIFLGEKIPTAVQFGLPNFIQSYFDPLSNPYDFSRSGSCSSLDVSFTLNRTNNIDSVKWDFGDGQRSQLLAPVNSYATAGIYTVKLIVYKVDCSGLNDTITHNIWIAAAADYLGADTGSCALISFQIGADYIPGASYLWNTESADNKISADTFGLYWLRIEQNGCSITDSINVYKKPSPIADITGTTMVCPGKGTVLNAANALANSYLWNTGETTSAIAVSKAGLYKVNITGNSCVVSDSVNVTWGDCEPFVPNAFTPNNDRWNNTFGVASGFLAIDFSMQVFDRWGNIVFLSGDNTRKWDGTYKGKTMPGGVYAWIIRYTNTRGVKYALQGTVLLIR